MTMFARLHELLSTLEDEEADTSTFCEEFVKVLQQCLKNSGDTLEGELTTFTWAINLFKKVRPKLPNTDEVDHMTCTLFQSCARTILNERFPQLVNTPELEAFVVAVNQAYLELHGVGFSHRFAMLQYLMKHHWHHPILVAMVTGEPIEQDTALQYVSSGEFPELFHLRIQMLLQQGCEDFALNLCNWCVQHKKFKHDPYVRGNQLVLMYERGFVDHVYEECRWLPCCVGVQIVQCLQEDRKRSTVFLDLAQTFLIKDWLKPRRYCCTKELLTLWLDGRRRTDADDKDFLYNVGKLLETAANTWQLMALLDTMHILFGKKFIQFYMEVCLLALTVDKYNLDLAECQEDTSLKESSIGSLTFTCTMISSLMTDWSLEMRKWSMLTALSMEAKADVYQAVKKLYTLHTEEHNKPGETGAENKNFSPVKDRDKNSPKEKPFKSLLTIKNVKNDTTKAVLRILSSLKMPHLKPLLQWKELKHHCLSVLSAVNITEAMAERVDDKQGQKQPNGVVGSSQENGHINSNAVDHSYTCLGPSGQKNTNSILTPPSCLSPTSAPCQVIGSRPTKSDDVRPDMKPVSQMPEFSSLLKKTFAQKKLQPEAAPHLPTVVRVGQSLLHPPQTEGLWSTRDSQKVASQTASLSLDMEPQTVQTASGPCLGQVMVVDSLDTEEMVSANVSSAATTSQPSSTIPVLSREVLPHATAPTPVLSQGIAPRVVVPQTSQNLSSQTLNSPINTSQAFSSQTLPTPALTSQHMTLTSAATPQTVTMHSMIPQSVAGQGLTLGVSAEVLSPQTVELLSLRSSADVSRNTELTMVTKSALSPTRVESESVPVMSPSKLISESGKVLASNTVFGDQSGVHSAPVVTKPTKPVILVKQIKPEPSSLVKQPVWQNVVQSEQLNIQSPHAGSTNIVPGVSRPSGREEVQPQLVQLQQKPVSKIQMVMPRLVSSTLRQTGTVVQRLVPRAQTPLSNQTQSSGLTFVTSHTSQANVVRLKVGGGGQPTQHVLPGSIQQQQQVAAQVAAQAAAGQKVLTGGSLRVVTDGSNPRPRSGKLLPAKLMMPPGLRVPMEMKVVNVQQIPTKVQPVFVSTPSSQSGLVSGQTGQGVQTIKLSGQEEVKAILQGFMNRSGPNAPSVAQVKDPTRRFFKTRTLTLSPAALQNMIPGRMGAASKVPCSTSSTCTGGGADQELDSNPDIEQQGDIPSEKKTEISRQLTGLPDRNIFSILSSRTSPPVVQQHGASLKPLQEVSLAQTPTEQHHQGIDYSCLRMSGEVTSTIVGSTPSSTHECPVGTIGAGVCTDPCTGTEQVGQSDWQPTVEVDEDGKGFSEVSKGVVETLGSVAIDTEVEEKADSLVDPIDPSMTVEESVKESAISAVSIPQTSVSTNKLPTALPSTLPLTVPDMTWSHTMNAASDNFSDVQLLRPDLSEVSNSTLLTSPVTCNPALVPSLQVPSPLALPSYISPASGDIQVISNPVLRSLPSVVQTGVGPVVSTTLQQAMVSANSSFMYGLAGNVVLGMGQQMGENSVLQLAAPGTLNEPVATGTQQHFTGVVLSAGSDQLPQAESQEIPKPSSEDADSYDDEIIECDAKGNPISSLFRVRHDVVPEPPAAPQTNNQAELDKKESVADAESVDGYISDSQLPSKQTVVRGSLLPESEVVGGVGTTSDEGEGRLVGNVNDYIEGSEAFISSPKGVSMKRDTSGETTPEKTAQVSEEVSEETGNLKCHAAQETANISIPTTTDTENKQPEPCQDLQSEEQPSPSCPCIPISSLSDEADQLHVVSDVLNEDLPQCGPEDGHGYSDIDQQCLQQSVPLNPEPSPADVKADEEEGSCAIGDSVEGEEVAVIPSNTSKLTSNTEGQAQNDPTTSLCVDFSRVTAKTAVGQVKAGMVEDESDVPQNDERTLNNEGHGDDVYNSRSVSAGSVDSEVANSSFESSQQVEHVNQSYTSDNPMVDVSTQTDDDDEFNSDGEGKQSWSVPQEAANKESIAQEDASSVCTLEDGGSQTSGSQTEQLPSSSRAGDVKTCETLREDDDQKDPEEGDEILGEDAELPLDLSMHGSDTPADTEDSPHIPGTLEPDLQPIPPKEENPILPGPSEGTGELVEKDTEGAQNTASESGPSIEATTSPTDDGSRSSVATTPNDDFICIDESDEEIQFHLRHKTVAAKTIMPNSQMFSEELKGAEKGERTTDEIPSSSKDQSQEGSNEEESRSNSVPLVVYEAGQSEKEATLNEGESNDSPPGQDGAEDSAVEFANRNDESGSLVTETRQTDPNGTSNGTRAAEGRRRHGTWIGYKWVFSPDKKNKGSGSFSASSSPRAKVKTDCKVQNQLVETDVGRYLNKDILVNNNESQSCTQTAKSLVKLSSSSTHSPPEKPKEIPISKVSKPKEKQTDSDKNRSESFSLDKPKQFKPRKRSSTESPVMPLRKSKRRSTQLDSTASASLRRAIRFNKTEHQVPGKDAQKSSSGRHSRSPSKIQKSGKLAREKGAGRPRKADKHSVKTDMKKHGNSLSAGSPSSDKGYDSSSDDTDNCDSECSTPPTGIPRTDSDKPSLSVKRLKNSPGFVPEVVERKTRFGFLRHPERDDRESQRKERKPNAARCIIKEEDNEGKHVSTGVQSVHKNSKSMPKTSTAAASSSAAAAAAEAAHRRTYQQVYTTWFKAQPKVAEGKGDTGDKCMCHTLPSKYKCWNPSCSRNAQLDAEKSAPKRIQKSKPVVAPTIVEAPSISKKVMAHGIDSKKVLDRQTPKHNQPQPTRIIEVGSAFQKRMIVTGKTERVGDATAAKSTSSPKARMVGDHIITVQPQLFSRAFDTWLSTQNHASTDDKGRPVLKTQISRGVQDLKSYRYPPGKKDRNSGPSPPAGQKATSIGNEEAKICSALTKPNCPRQGRKSSLQNSVSVHANSTFSEPEGNPKQNARKRPLQKAATEQDPSTNKKVSKDAGDVEKKKDGGTDETPDLDLERRRSVSDQSDAEDSFIKAFTDWTKGESDPTEVRYAHIKTYSRNGRTKSGPSTSTATGETSKPSAEKSDYQGAFQEWISVSKKE